MRGTSLLFAGDQRTEHQNTHGNFFMSNVTDVLTGNQTQTRELALITQMRAGTHFLCYALRVALEASIYLPDRERRYIRMDDDYILRGLHLGREIALPLERPNCAVYFNHYYHPQQHTLPNIPRIYLIGFPFDSFYSDGVVYSEGSYDVGPSGPRASGYVMCAGSSEWKFLEEKMIENAEWLAKIAEFRRLYHSSL